MIGMWPGGLKGGTLVAGSLIRPGLFPPLGAVLSPVLFTCVRPFSPARQTPWEYSWLAGSWVVVVVVWLVMVVWLVLSSGLVSVGLDGLKLTISFFTS